MACLLPLARLSISTKPLTRQMGLLPHPGAFFFRQKRLAALAGDVEFDGRNAVDANLLSRAASRRGDPAESE